MKIRVNLSSTIAPEITDSSTLPTATTRSSGHVYLRRAVLKYAGSGEPARDNVCGWVVDDSSRDVGGRICLICGIVAVSKTFLSLSLSLSLSFLSGNRAVCLVSTQRFCPSAFKGDAGAGHNRVKPALIRGQASTGVISIVGW